MYAAALFKQLFFYIINIHISKTVGPGLNKFQGNIKM